MKVIIAHNNYEITGGAEVFFHETARVLKKNGHEVALFCSYNENVNSKWKKYFPKNINYTNSKIEAMFQFKEMVYSKRSKESFKRLIEDFKPDIIHVFGIYIKLTPSFLEVCRQKGIPIVMSCNDYKHITPNYKLYPQNQQERFKRRQSLSKNLFYDVGNYIEFMIHKFLDIYRRNVNTFLFASNFMAEETEKYWGKETFKWDILKNPFNSNDFKISKIQKDYYLFFGRLSEEKGVDILIKAAAKNKECKLKIIGDGPEKNRLIKLAKKLKAENVDFCGPMWGNDLEEVLSKSRFVVVPSLWHENFPYVILQSFALGKAVIGSSVGGIPELIQENYNGYLYENDDIVDLASKIKFLWENNSIAVKMGGNAKIFSDKNFNDENFYKNLIKIYKRTLQ